VGLDMELWERMRWEVERGGRWVAATSNGDEERIQRTEARRWPGPLEQVWVLFAGGEVCAQEDGWHRCTHL
jgi:hypothetical protein